VLSEAKIVKGFYMKYLPATIYALGVCATVIAALLITRETGALWALFLLVFVNDLLPKEK